MAKEKKNLIIVDEIELDTDSKVKDFVEQLEAGIVITKDGKINRKKQAVMYFKSYIIALNSTDHPGKTVVCNLNHDEYQKFKVSTNKGKVGEVINVEFDPKNVQIFEPDNLKSIAEYGLTLLNALENDLPLMVH